jgi:hypothetical protein
MANKFFSVACVVSVALLVGCGGGGGGGGSPVTGFSQTYTTSAAVGEVIEYTFDTSRNVYSYTVKYSEYGCDVPSAACNKGSGTLTKNEDGSYTPSGSPNTKIYAVQNGLILGTIQVAPNLPVAPLIGVSNPVSASSDVAGTYNYVSIQCPTKVVGNFNGCSSYVGSVKVTSTSATTANYLTCENDDIDKATPNCGGSTTGTLRYTGSGGIWEMIRSGSSAKSFLVTQKSPNGQNVGFLDFNDPGGYGYGQATMSTKITFTPDDLTKNLGNWIMTSIQGNIQKFTMNTDGSTSLGGVGVPNTPWNGMVRFPDGVTGIQSGNGLSVLGKPGNKNYLVAIRM